MQYSNLISELASSQRTYELWFQSATDVQRDMLWKEVWDNAAQCRNGTKFLEDLYAYWQINNRLTHRQFFHVIKIISPDALKIHRLSDRTK